MFIEVVVINGLVNRHYIGLQYILFRTCQFLVLYSIIPGCILLCSMRELKVEFGARHQDYD